MSSTILAVFKQHQPKCEMYMMTTMTHDSYESHYHQLLRKGKSFNIFIRTFKNSETINRDPQSINWYKNKYI